MISTANSFIGSLKKINSKLFQYTLSVITIAVTAFICSPLANTQNYHLVSFILLFVVSILSTFLRIGPVLLASTLGALVWNYFFIPPHYTFHIDKTEDILIFALFFIIALANGILTTRIKLQEELAKEREKRTNALFDLTKALSSASGLDEVVEVAKNKIVDNFSMNAFFILQDGNNKLLSSGRIEKKQLTKDEYNVAEWVFKNKQKAGLNTNSTFNVNYTFYPLSGTRLNPGVIAINPKKSLPDEQASYWNTFLVQISNALEREFLGELAQKVRFLDESDRLYKTLFNSISHELRIPVATIMGASDSILNTSNQPTTQKALCTEIFTASLRLNRLIENLLNISRLESGFISVRADWCDVNDLINKVSEDLSDELKPFTFCVNIPEDMPLVKIDFGLMEQVLYNILYNSTQYAPATSIITINTAYNKREMVIELIDNGPGFKEDEIKNVFTKFYRGNISKTGGLGLGLSIVKGFVEAHKGTISVENNISGGAKFTIRIPTKKPNIKNLNA